MFGKLSRRQWVATLLGGLLGLHSRTLRAAPRPERMQPSAPAPCQGAYPGDYSGAGRVTTTTYYYGGQGCDFDGARHSRPSRDRLGRVTATVYDRDGPGHRITTWVYDAGADEPG